jgi:hypothetical protein
MVLLIRPLHLLHWIMAGCNTCKQGFTVPVVAVRTWWNEHALLLSQGEIPSLTAPVCNSKRRSTQQRSPEKFGCYSCLVLWMSRIRFPLHFLQFVWFKHFLGLIITFLDMLWAKSEVSQENFMLCVPQIHSSNSIFQVSSFVPCVLL